MKTLEEEKEELKEYQCWDKQRRCLEYTIHERELKENKRKLEELEKSRANSGAEQARLCAEAKTAQEMVRAATKRLKEAKKEVQTAKEERDTLRYIRYIIFEKLCTSNLMIANSKLKMKFAVLNSNNY